MRKRRNDSGQSIVELAIVLPLLMLIVLGCLDLGRAFFVWMALANGTREGAYLASVYVDKTATEIQECARRDIIAQGLDPDSLSVEPHWDEGPYYGKPVRVTAEYTLPMFTTYLFGGQPIRIRAETQMVLLGGTGGY